MLIRFGFELKSQNGSHRGFAHPRHGLYVSLVERSGKLKPVYVEAAVEAIDQVIAAEGE